MKTEFSPMNLLHCNDEKGVNSTMNNTKKRVCCLYRVSTDKQVDYNNNHEADIPMQRKACHRFAEEKGWTIVHEEQEEGVSGHKVRAENRDKLQIIKEMAMRKEFDILLVFMFDRIGRIADETPFVVEWFVNNGIEVWSTQEGEQRFENHIDKLMNYIRFWQADGESEKTSIRTRTSLGQMVEEGHYKGGSPAFGYELVKSGRINKRKHELYDLKINEAEAAAVQLIYDLYTRQGYGVQKIANYLTERGYANRKGGRWSHNSIRNILHNSTYMGVLRSGESRSPILSELQIVTPEQYARAREIFRQRNEQRANQHRVPINMRGHSLLNGNVFCGHCGARLNLTTGRRVRHHADGSLKITRRINYVCYGKSRKLTACDGQTTYVQETLDKIVDAVVKDVFRQMTGIPKSELIASQYAHEIEQNKVHLAEVNGRYAEAAEKVSILKAEVVKSIQGKSAFSPQMLSELIEEAETEATECEGIRDAAERAVRDSELLLKNICARYDEIISWAELYDNASMEAKKMIVNSLIQRVNVFKGYRLEIEFNFDLRQFFAGLDKELPKNISA